MKKIKLFFFFIKFKVSFYLNNYCENLYLKQRDNFEQKFFVNYKNFIRFILNKKIITINKSLY